ncbi:MAG: OmpA family protein [Longimicrobiales bacterium]|nr:OmpA family protein [Longimicrobiales bacterium]
MSSRNNGLFPTSRRSLVLLAGLGLALTASACGYASQENVDSQLAEIREQMNQGDQENAQAISDVESDVSQLQNRVSSLESDLQDLQEEFNTTVERLETSLRFSTPIHFAYDEAEIRQQDHTFLDRFAAVAETYYPDATVTVEGFTDPAGSDAYNMQLGQRRADAVRTYLTEQAGLSADRVRAVSYGENTNRLINPNAQGPEDGIANRRVTLVVDYVPRSGAMSSSGSGS